MANLILVLFLCFTVPLLMLTQFLPKESRRVCLGLIIGMVIAALASPINTWFIDTLPKSPYYITTNISPFVEELLKLIVIAVLAFWKKPDRNALLYFSMSLGVGFALIENAYVLLINLESISLLWTLCRVFGASIMHAVSAAIIGFGFSFVRTRKKLFITGTFALFIVATVFHSVFNSLIQSSFYYLAIIGVIECAAAFRLISGQIRR